MTRNRTALIAFVVLVMIAVVLAIFSQRADADSHKDECVPADAWTETIEHPEVTEVVHHDAVTETVHHPAVTETVPAIWEVFSPNNTQGPYEGPPTWPTDAGGTWQAAAEAIPPGHVGPDGVYQMGEGNGSWFYRQAERVIVITEAYDEEVVVEEAWDETVVVEEAWTETIEHPEVICDDEQPDPLVQETSSTERDCDDKVQVTTLVVTTTEYVQNESGEWVLGEPVSETTVSEQPVKPGKCDEEPQIEEPGPGETVTFQSFDGEGNLVEQRVSEPIDPEAQQEGM